MRSRATGGAVVTMVALSASCGPRRITAGTADMWTPGGDATADAPGRDGARPPPAAVYGDYDAEPRDSTGHVDVPTLMTRLKALHANTYAFLVYHAPTDYGDLMTFLPAAAAAGLRVWAYLVPPTEYPSYALPPCNQDYVCWARTLAGLAATNPDLKAYVIDDFTSNLSTFTPSYLAMMKAAAGTLPLYGVSYYAGSLPAYLDTDYSKGIDGIVFPYQDLDSTATLQGQMDQMCELMHRRMASLRMSVPGMTPSSAGDSIAVTDGAATATAASGSLSFRYLDSYTGPTSGYHFLQLLVGGSVVWETDVAGGGTWQQANVALNGLPAGPLPVAFRIYDKMGVTNFAVDVHVYAVTAKGLDLGAGGTGSWTVSSTGSGSTWSASSAVASYSGPCTLMVYTTATSWHPAQPTNAYIQAALATGQAGIAAGTTDGVMTYCLDKSASSPDFSTVAALYQAWNVTPDAGP